MSITAKHRETNGNHNVYRIQASIHGWILTGFRPWFCGTVFLLWLSPMVSAQYHQMQISKNRTLVLETCELLDPVPGTSNVQMFGVVLQKKPFVKIHLARPLPENRLGKRGARFFCEEVGVFNDPQSQQTWTIGKRCKLSLEPYQNGRQKNSFGGR